MSRKLLILVALSLLLAGCAAGTDNFAAADDQANFFHGIWHGWIAPIALIWRAFGGEVTIYESNNTGWWYDFGFYIAIISGFGSVALRRGNSKQKPES